MTTKTRITAQTVRENRARDNTPKWINADTWTGEQFTAHYHEAMSWYNLEVNAKDLKAKLVDWMGRNGYTRDQLVDFKRIKDWRISPTMGAIADCLNRGMPEVHKEFNKGRNTADWLKNAIATVFEQGRYDLEPVEEVKKPVGDVYVPSIQERMHMAAAFMCEDIDQAIDDYIQNPDSFDPKQLKVAGLLRSKGAKPAHARLIKDFYQAALAEFQSLNDTACDEQLLEGYSSYGRRNLKKMLDFLTSVQNACDQIIGEAKLVKKPRVKKTRPAEDLVKKIKFKATDDKLGIASIPATQLIGAQGAVVYNTKTRKLGYYIAKTSGGLGVKGASVDNFTEKSMQKTLRKPELQIREFKDQNTKSRIEKWFAKSVTTTEVTLTGRINAEVMILKVFK